MKLPEEDLVPLREATEKCRKAKLAFTDAALNRSMAISAEEYHTKIFLEANNDLNKLQAPYIEKYGEEVRIDMDSGEIILPKKDA